MKMYYANDGKPNEQGNLCLVIDAEDGNQQIVKIYGKTTEEVEEKKSKMLGHANSRIIELKKELAAAGLPTRKQNDSISVAAPKKFEPMTPGDRMQKTHELNNAETSSAAAAALVEQELGVPLSDVRDLVADRNRRREADRITGIIESWVEKNPDFPVHPTNQRMMVDQITIKCGIENVTHDILDATFQELQDAQLLVAAAKPAVEEPAPSVDHTPPQGEARRTAATSVQRNQLTARPGSTTATRWTEAEIDKVVNGPVDEYERLLRADSTFVTAINDRATKGRKRAS